MRTLLLGLAMATSIAGAASATTSIPVQQPNAAVQQADWYCGPNCQRHRYWQERHAEHWRERQAYRYNHPYAYRTSPYYYYR